MDFQSFSLYIGGIQPRAIANAFKPSWADEGFVQRWLYVYPQVLPEKEYKDNVLDEMYKTAWYEMTDKLSAIGDMKLLLSTEAKVLLTEFNKETAKKEKDADPWVASILSKIRIQIENGVPLPTSFLVEKVRAQDNTLHCQHQ